MGASAFRGLINCFGGIRKRSHKEQGLLGTLGPMLCYGNPYINSFFLFFFLFGLPPEITAACFLSLFDSESRNERRMLIYVLHVILFCQARQAAWRRHSLIQSLLLILTMNSIAYTTVCDNYALVCSCFC
jgi:hypothetical protein